MGARRRRPAQRSRASLRSRRLAHPHAQVERSPPRLSNPLPPRPTRLIGRERELAKLLDLLLRKDARLVTLTGPPGIGKTRLALEAATLAAGGFADDVIFVDLSPVRDTGLVVATIAQTLGIEERPKVPPLLSVIEALEHTSSLLVLDNFEQVVDAAPRVADLLSACGGLKILATSRSPLGLRWERRFPVPPLDLPLLPHAGPEQIAASPAVALFADRAQAVRLDFVLNGGNAQVVAEICARLDGVPLAIELAAARIGMLSPSALASQLQRTLDLTSLRDAPERHRTLRAAIKWSYDLLELDQRSIFRCLSVFDGGCSMDAAAAVCRTDSEAGLTELIAALLERSLVQMQDDSVQDSGWRVRMLESVREYGLEQLTLTGEEEAVRQRHAAYFLALAERAGPELTGTTRPIHLRLLERDLPNLRAALRWLLERRETELGLRLTTALLWFWDPRSWTEGLRWLEDFLATDIRVSPAIRAKALSDTGHLLYHQGELQRSRALLDEAIAMFRQLGDRRGLAETLNHVGVVLRRQGAHTQAIPVHEETLALFREAGNSFEITETLNILGICHRKRGDYDRAVALSREALAIAQDSSLRRQVAVSLVTLGHTLQQQGKDEEASQFLDEGLAICREVSAKWMATHALRGLGSIALRHGHHDRAEALFSEAMTISRDLADTEGIAAALRYHGMLSVKQGARGRGVRLLQESLLLCRDVNASLDIVIRNLENLGEATARERPQEASQLLGAAGALRDANDLPVPPVDCSDLEHARTVLKRKVGQRRFDRAFAAGSTIPLEESIRVALALTVTPDGSGGALDMVKRSGPLTRREEGVAALVAEGLSNRAIAARLFISERTAEYHVQGILNKLGFSSRAQIATWATRQGLGS